MFEFGGGVLVACSNGNSFYVDKSLYSQVNHLNRMASTDSSQMNFNPSWMQLPSKGERPNGFALPVEGDSLHEVMDPVFANHRYGREDMLALMSKDIKPPDGLKDCPFFVDKAQIPMILMPLNEIELRLQQNINSSKALSVLSRQDRNTFLNGNDSPTPNPSTNHNKWTVAGANRGINTANKPISNRWSTVAYANNNNNAGDLNCSSRGGRMGLPHFGRTGGGVRLGDPPNSSSSKTFNPRFRQSSNHNDGGGLAFSSGNANAAPAADNLPTPSTSTQHNPWTRVGKLVGQSTTVAAVLSGDASDTSQPKQPAVLKSGEQAKVLLEELSRPALVGGQDTKNNLLPGYQQQPQPIRPRSEAAADQRLPPTQPPPNQHRPVIEKHSGPPKPTDIKWNYLDPSGVERGPFESRQMQAWFENGYFDGTLVVTKAGSKKYITLSDLFAINGAITPFIVKSASTTPPAERDGGVTKSFDAMNRPKVAVQPAANSTHFGSSPVMTCQTAASIWSDVSSVGNATTTPISRVLSPYLVGGGGEDLSSMYKPPQDTGVIDKILQEKQFALAEEQRKLREKEELLLREERERAEKELEIRQRELELQRKQVELERIAREKEQELETKRLQMAEFERQRREALERIEEKLRNEQLQQIRQIEEERLRLESAAAERRKAEEERHLREQEEAKICAAYEEARRLKEMAQRAEEEQRKALLAEQEARKRREREDRERAAALEAKQKREREERVLAEKRQREEEDECSKRRLMEEELSRAAIQEILSAEQNPQKPKATPWVTVGGAKAGNGKKDKSAKSDEICGKSLLEIQREEELALRESLERRQEELQRNSQMASQQPSGAWTTAERNLGWSTPPVTSSKQGGSHVVWGNVLAPVPAEIPKANAPTKKANAQKKQQPQQTKKPEAAAATKPKADAFTSWIIRRVRELNSSVDAEVFAAFIEGVESPDEAEDYIIGYLGESKAAKEFHREFLAKRIELRPRALRMTKDDLSCPAAAARDVLGGATSSGLSGGSKDKDNEKNVLNKKKKGKKIDPTVLGFRAAGDPNRFNAGEIDTTIPAPANRRR